MKRMIYGLTMAASLLFVAGCEKDNPQNPLSSKKPSPGTEKAIPNINVTATYHCGGRVCNASEQVSTNKYNMIAIQNTSGSSLPSLRYSIYQRVFSGGGIEVYQPIIEYTCSETNTGYAGTLVPNNTKILVIASDPAFSGPPTGNQALIGGVLTPSLANSTYTTVTTGNYLGQGCGGNPPG